jgi:hypothetical protein
MTSSIWRIGQFLNSVQTSFVGLLQIWSIPLVLLLSLASGYTTYYGLSHFITDWIAVVITVAVQSVIVICSLELASVHWRANIPRFITVNATLAVALFVSISFSYFKFYELSHRDTILLDRERQLNADINTFLTEVIRQKAALIADQRNRTEKAALEAKQAFLNALPSQQQNKRGRIGRGRVWSHFNQLQQGEQSRLKDLATQLQAIDAPIQETRGALQRFSLDLGNAAAYDQVTAAVNNVSSVAERLIAGQGGETIARPKLVSYGSFSRGMTPSFAMWEDLSWFALACAAMVDFFTLVLSYRLEFTAPGPLTDEERDLAFRGIVEFNEFRVNDNDELEFIIEKTELERARRYADWLRMFVVAFLLNRGFLRKVDPRSVEFAPNLYPIIADRLRSDAAGLSRLPEPSERLRVLMNHKSHG